MRLLYTSLFAAWLAAFGWETHAIARAVLGLRQTADAYESTARQLNREAGELTGISHQIQDQSKELEFLQGLTNVLPQEKGFLRTQEAISDEVQALRRKVGRRVHQQLQIIVDARANKLYLKKGLTLLWEADCSVGRGGVLRDKATGRRWEFATPRGQFEVLTKIDHPIWIKPDWAFVEAGQPIPPPGDPKRRVPGELGDYALNLGDGYLIHGTPEENLIGHPVSHGCVRLGAVDLKKLYDSVSVGTRVYIY